MAVEHYRPNLPIAARRLKPLDVEVVERTNGRLPVDEGQFDLVLNRHGYLNPEEMYRVLGPDGLRIVSWQAPGFDPVRHRAQLRQIHDHIADTRGFAHTRRFLVLARK